MFNDVKIIHSFNKTAIKMSIKASLCYIASPFETALCTSRFWYPDGVFYCLMFTYYWPLVTYFAKVYSSIGVLKRIIRGKNVIKAAFKTKKTPKNKSAGSSTNTRHPFDHVFVFLLFQFSCSFLVC